MGFFQLIFPKMPRWPCCPPNLDLEYNIILWLASNGDPLPPLTLEKAHKNLVSLKKTVHDCFSISPLHYIHAGPQGIRLFHAQLSNIITHISTSSSQAINQVISILLHKGHGKDPTSDTSNRTISNCTVLAKGLDSYIGSLHSPIWDKSQTDSQFQAPNSSHELAALQITELINMSLNIYNRPLYALFLDVKSCFDRVLPQSVIRSAYSVGSQGNILNLLNNRLTNRSSLIKFHEQIIGPIFTHRVSNRVAYYLIENSGWLGINN